MSLLGNSFSESLYLVMERKRGDTSRKGKTGSMWMISMNSC